MPIEFSSGSGRVHGGSRRLVKRYAEGSEFEGLAREIARDYDRGIVDEFEKQDLTDACAAVS